MAGLNQTPSADRIHIGFFGRRNAGKSSVMNAVCGQDLAVVSPIGGTTTDPVVKSMELLPLGPVVMMDTPGLDDEGELGDLRVKKSLQTLNKTDVAVLVADASAGLYPEDLEIIHRIGKKKIPVLLAFNKTDLEKDQEGEGRRQKEKAALDAGLRPEEILWDSAKTGEGIHELKERMAKAGAKQ